MNIIIQDKAIEWFKDEVECVPGDNIQFHVRYGGDSAVQQGFSLGFAYGTPTDIAASKKVDDILFFIESKDIWFFDGHHLHVQYDETQDEIYYQYKK